MRDHFSELFDYDLWANQQWIAAIPNLPDPERAREVLTHILKAQYIWLTRCLSEESNTSLTGDFEQDAAHLHRAWKELVRVADLNAYIAYNNLAGEPFMNLLSEIVAHVVNHGTYHRGHLRGLCEAGKTDDFPETDFILFTR